MINLNTKYTELRPRSTGASGNEAIRKEVFDIRHDYDWTPSEEIEIDNRKEKAMSM